MPNRPEWVTMSTATQFTGRSRRSIRRWIADPANQIRTVEHDNTRYINLADLLRVEAFKHAYTVAPTFGKERKPLLGTVSEQRDTPGNRASSNVANVTALL